MPRRGKILLRGLVEERKPSADNSQGGTFLNFSWDQRV